MEWKIETTFVFYNGTFGGDGVHHAYFGMRRKAASTSAREILCQRKRTFKILDKASHIQKIGRDQV